MFAIGLTENNNENYDFAGGSLGIKDFEYIHTHFPNKIFVKLIEETDFAELYDAEQEEFLRQERKQKIRNYKIAGILLLILLAIVGVYNLPYFAEKRAYNKVLDDMTETDGLNYLDKYGDSKNAPEVTFLLIQYYLKNSMKFFPEHAPMSQRVPGLNKAFQYMGNIQERFPENKFAKKAGLQYDSIWNGEINKFVKNNPDYRSSKSKLAMYNMLQYMKEHRMYEIILYIKPDVQLKDFEEFDKSTLSLFESMGVKSYHIENLKKYFGSTMLHNLAIEVKDQLSQSLDEVLTPGFIRVNLRNEKEPDNKRKPSIDFSYSIKNQMENFMGQTIPSIWTEDYPRHTQLLGITMACNAYISYADESKIELFKAIGDPGNYIINVSSTSDAYTKMANACIEDFGKQLCRALGI